MKGGLECWGGFGIFTIKTCWDIAPSGFHTAAREHRLMGGRWKVGKESTAGPARVGADSAFPNTGECAFFSGYDPYSRSSEPRGYMGPDPALH